MNKNKDKLNKLFDGELKFGSVSEQRGEEVERDVNIELFYQHVLNHREETELRFIDPSKEKSVFAQFCSSLDAVKRYCRRYDGKYNIYAGVNERSKGGKKDKDVLSISCLFFDADAHSGEPIADAKRDIYSLTSKMEEKFGDLKYVVVFTGHGYALYVPIDTISTKYAGSWRRLSEHLCADATGGSGTGTFDTAVWNISRVMRVPGTLNIKSDPVRSYIYDFSSPANPQNARISRLIREMGEDISKEEEEDQRDYTYTNANNANFGENNKDREGEREKDDAGDSNFDKCLQYLCEWLIEGIHDPRATHEVRREIVTRLNWALMRDGIEIKKRKKIIFDFLKKNVAWSDFDAKITAYQVNHIIENGYNPSKCKKTNCPFKKSCKRQNFWRRKKKEKKEKRKSRFKRGAESFKERRYRSIIDLLPDGNGESIIDVRHLGAGKSTEAREEIDEGVFIYKTCKERDEACARDNSMVPVFSRFEGNKSPDPPDMDEDPDGYLSWMINEGKKKRYGDERDDYACHFVREIKMNIGKGSRPASCGGCPYCPDRDGHVRNEEREVCFYPEYAKGVLSGAHRKYGVTSHMCRAKAFQKKRGHVILDDVPITDAIIDEKTATKEEIEDSLHILYGEDGVIQQNMADIWREEIRKALNGDKKSLESVAFQIGRIEAYRDYCIFNGDTVPINIAYLGTAFYYFKKEDDGKAVYTFFIENDSALRDSNDKLKTMRYISATPAVADALFLKMCYPDAQLIKDDEKISRKIKITQITDGAYPNQTLRREKSKKRAESGLRQVLRNYKVRGELEKTLIFMSKKEKEKESSRKIIEEFSDAHFDYYFSSTSQNTNDYENYNNIVVFGAPPISPETYDVMNAYMSCKNFSVNGEPFLTSEEYQYLSAVREIKQVVGRIRPYNKDKKGEITLLTNIDVDFDADPSQIKKMTLKEFLKKKDRDMRRDIPKYILYVLLHSDLKSVSYPSIVNLIIEIFGVSRSSAYDYLHKVVLRLKRVKNIVIQRGRTQKRGRRPLLIIFLDRIKTLFDFGFDFNFDDEGDPAGSKRGRESHFKSDAWGG